MRPVEPVRTDSPAVCPLCGSAQSIRMGIRGTREYFGADPQADPHLITDVLRCSTCDFIYAYPMHERMLALEQAYYDDPERYSATAGSDSSAMYQTRLDLVAAYKAGGTLLDVGAGKGEFLALARDAGWKVEGVEPSTSFRRYAMDRHGIECHAGYLGDSALLAEHSFDVITLNHVLEHVERPHGFLEMTRRYLKADGVVFIEVPNCDSYFLRAADLYFRLKGLTWSSRLSPFHPPFHRFGFTRRSLTELLERSGFRVLRTTTFSGKDRGFKQKKSSWHPEVMLREGATAFLQFLGNRELLAVIVKPMGS